MAFKVPDSKKSIAQNRFEFEVGDTTYTVPLLKYLPVKAAAAFERGDNVEGILLGCDTEESRNAVLSLDGEQFELLMDEWAKASGVNVGESSAS